MSGAVRAGITLQAVDPPGAFGGLVELIESAGYDYLWVADSSLHARDVWAYLTLAAVRSERLRVGTNCTHPHTRHPAITLNALVTLHELSGGRAILGLGAGDSPVTELGLPIATLDQVAATIAAARRLLAGERFDLDHAHLTLRNAGVHHGLHALDSPPVYVTASGPRMLELAGRLGDGVLVHCGASRSGIEFALARIRDGAVEAGRDPDAIDVVWQLFGTVDDDPRRAIGATRPMAAWFAATAPRYCELAGADPDTLERIRRRYAGGEFHEAVAAQELTPDPLVRSLLVAGGAAAWHERFDIAREVGVRHVAIWPMGDRQHTIREVARLLADRPTGR